MEPLDLLMEIGRFMDNKGLNSYDTSVLDLENLLIEEMNKED
ncbi:hypothetical protein [Bacillus sp. 7894-2]|nr:hypothetical protein [Bacillus sp. 7894-2]